MSKRDQNTLPLNYDAVHYDGQTSSSFTRELNIKNFTGHVNTLLRMIKTIILLEKQKHGRTCIKSCLVGLNVYHNPLSSTRSSFVIFRNGQLE